MIEIDDKIISDDILEEQFVCDLSQCKGVCCVEGDAGAPLEKEEINILEEIYPVVKSEMRQQGIDAVEKEQEWLNYDRYTISTLINCSEGVFGDLIEDCVNDFIQIKQNRPRIDSQNAIESTKKINTSKLRQKSSDKFDSGATENFNFNELSMGMSSDFLKAAENLSTYIRIGTSIFGSRFLSGKLKISIYS